MEWTRYNAGVRLVWGGEGPTIDLPVAALTVAPEPYVGSGAHVSTLFDGRRKMEPLGFGYRAAFDWSYLHRAEHEALSSVVSAFLTYGPAESLYLSRLQAGGYDPEKVLSNVVFDMDASDVSAVFETRLRRRPASLTILTESQQLPWYTWLAK